MYDDDEVTSSMGGDYDDFDDYVDFIKALKDDGLSPREIVEEMVNEFDISQEEAVKAFKRFIKERRDEEEDDEDDIVEDDDYGDGNSEN